MKPRVSGMKRGVFHSRPKNDADGRPSAPAYRVGGVPQGIRILAFNKPFGVICQFTGEGAHPTLANFIRIPDVYPAGRLDTDSEGLLLLTNHGALQNWISSPARRRSSPLAKTYWVQVEGEPDDDAMERLCQPLDLGDFITLPSKAQRMPPPPGLWARNPPIRQRASIPTSWVCLTLVEGKNRQVRRMTAKVGFPTLRLIRAAVGPIDILGLHPGHWRDVTLAEIGYAK